MLSSQRPYHTTALHHNRFAHVLILPERPVPAPRLDVAVRLYSRHRWAALGLLCPSCGEVRPRNAHVKRFSCAPSTADSVSVARSKYASSKPFSRMCVSFLCQLIPTALFVEASIGKSNKLSNKTCRSCLYIHIIYICSRVRG